MRITTKLAPRIVPLCTVALLISGVIGGAVIVGGKHHQATDTLVARTAAPVPASYPVGENRAQAESEIQLDGMSLDTENALIHRTDFYWHHGDYPRIIALDRVITEIDPQNIDTYSTGGWLLESDGDNAEAEAYYALGMLRNPSRSDAAFSLAMFYYNTVHEYKQAEQVLSKSVHDPDAGVLDWKLLAHTYESEGDYVKAVATWKHIQRDYPTTPALQSNLKRDEAILANGGQVPVSPTASAGDNSNASSATQTTSPTPPASAPK